MHPLIASALATQLASRPAVRPHPRTRTRGTPEAVGDVVIRVASPADAAALFRLGSLDGNRSAGERLADAAADHAVLVAEGGGPLEGPLGRGRGLAGPDPVRSSAAHPQLP